MTEKIYQAFSRFSGRFKGHVCGQENGAGDGLGTRLLATYVYLNQSFELVAFTGKGVEIDYNFDSSAFLGIWTFLECECGEGAKALLGENCTSSHFCELGVCHGWAFHL